MIDVKRIFPECCADTLLVQLILQRGRPPHYHGINNVGIAMKEYDKNDVIVGVVDTDKFKRKDPNIELFTEVVEDKLADEKLIVKKYPETNKYIIRIHPAFEKWILSVAEDCDVKPENYGFDSFEKIKNAAKDENVYANNEFKKFINAIIQKNPPAIQTLRHWLSKADSEN